MAERPTPGTVVEYLDKHGMAHTALVLEATADNLLLRVWRTARPNLDIRVTDTQWRWSRWHKEEAVKAPAVVEYEYFETTVPRGEDDRGPVEPPRSAGAGWTLCEKLERGPMLVFRWRRRVAKPKA